MIDPIIVTSFFNFSLLMNDVSMVNGWITLMNCLIDFGIEEKTICMTKMPTSFPLNCGFFITYKFC